MRNYLTKIVNHNWFFVSLLLFVLAIPFSEAIVSILGGVILFTALVEDTFENKIVRLKENRILWFFMGTFFVYLLSSIITYNNGEALYDLKKNLFYLIIPLAFIIGKPINDYQKRFLFYSFSFAVIVSIIVSLIRWLTVVDEGNFAVHQASLVSHIRFSFQLILVFWFLIIFLLNHKKTLTIKHKAVLIFLAFLTISFLFFQQSLTGLIALGGSIIFYLIHLVIQLNKRLKIVLLILIGSLIIFPFVYVYSVTQSFYDIEKVDKQAIDQKTARGNYYTHDFDNPMVENSRYVFLYLCEDELREEWNKISECKYDSIGKNGYVNSATLIRYLTSKGLRKDAEGIKALNKQDVKNIENGIANVIYQEKRFSLYPRIYQTVWEYYVYSKTGNANYQSFSQRIEFWKAAVTIIKKNPLFGVGTGKWKNEFKKAYQENKSRLSEELYASSHNQYLNYLVKFGFTGFLLIMFFIIYPVVQTKRYSDVLFMIFLVFLFFANFSDSNFESHMGNSFFIFFYCLFLIAGSANYLKLRVE